ncbi:MAG: alpha-glucosidase C-terminal domain-containing protein [Ignavibacteriales bacterium]|nr:alpha-glucosidase C-terminal domain-containing protein [Ignavibacteriales bacterium]
MKKFIFSIILFSSLRSQIPTPYAKDSARSSEDWVKSGIIYEVYTRAFSKEGNFAGVEKRLPELKKLGVSILWIMPIHPVGVEKRKGTLGSPYSIQDYYGVNPEFGTLDDFKQLVNKSHELGFKIVIDLVANHTAWDSKMINEHPEWFTKDTSGNFVPPVADWSDVVDLNYDNKDLRAYMIEMMKYWVQDVGIDGFRCDVSEMVPTDFWNEARAALDSIKPVFMLSEGMYAEHHLKAFDATYGWNSYHTMAQIFKGEKPASEMDSVLIRESMAYPKGSLRMRFSSNHDENAWDMPDVEKFGKEGVKLAAVLTNTFPGIPLLYNGQEVGNNVKLGLFEKFEIDWKKGKEWTEFYKKVYTIRRSNPSLATGDYQYVKNNRPEHVYSFIRTDGMNTILALFNFSNSERTVTLELPKAFPSLKFTNAFTGKKAAYRNVAKVTLPKFGYRVFVVE